jgi:hypothetical protein
MKRFAVFSTFEPEVSRRNPPGPCRSQSKLGGIAERCRTERIRILDLIQKGNDGLMVALKTFSDCGEDNFSAHATTHIERAILEAVASSDSTSA